MSRFSFLFCCWWYLPNVFILQGHFRIYRFSSSDSFLTGGGLHFLTECYTHPSPNHRILKQKGLKKECGSGKSFLFFFLFLANFPCYKSFKSRRPPESLDDPPSSKDVFSPAYSTSKRSIEYLLTYVAYSRIGQTGHQKCDLFLCSAALPNNKKEPFLLLMVSPSF